MILDLFIVRAGTRVKHGSPYYETSEVIESIKEEPDYVKIQFESGKFTYIPTKDFSILKEYGEVGYMRARGFTAHESILL
jgi:hypothetical protein